MSPAPRPRQLTWLAAAAGAAGLALPWLTVALHARRMIPSDAALRLAPGDLPHTALVLGAQVWPSGHPSRYLKGRLDLAAELHRAGLVQVLLCSGAGGPEHQHEPTAMRRYLEQAGVPAGDIIEDPAGFDTYDSCRRARDVYGLTALTVVSQSFHVPRALTICRALGIRAVGVGDESVRVGAEGDKWRRYQVREVGANVKMVRDVASRRPASRP